MNQATDDVRLRLAVPNVDSHDRIRFLFPEGVMEFRGTDADAVRSAIALADGSRTRLHLTEALAEIVASRAVDVVADLESLGILLDVNHLYRAHLLHERNPQRLAHARSPAELTGQRLARFAPEELDAPAPTTPLGVLALARRSCRSFDPGHLLSAEDLTPLLRLAYSDSVRPVASAGGLYPLRMAVFLRQPGGDEYARLWWSRGSDRLERFGTVDSRTLAYALDDQHCLYSAAAVVVVMAELDVPAFKYGNRAYRYALLEAGQCVQMLTMAATESGLGSLEYGGFRDVCLAEVCGAPPELDPIIVLAIGRASQGEQASDPSPATDAAVGDGRAVLSVGVRLDDSSTRTPVVLAIARFGHPSPHTEVLDKYDRIAAGAAQSTVIATARAVFEAVERHAVGRVRVDLEETAVELDEQGLRWLDPRLMAPLAQDTHVAVDWLRPFDPHLPWQWVEGHDAYGHPVLAPIDMVFYPLATQLLNRPLCTLANSSGVAAHTTIERARDAAMMELIERDAFMRSWWGQRPPSRLGPGAGPAWWTARQRALSAEGVSATALVLQAHLPTALVVYRQERSPALVCGAACAPTYEMALRKSLDEADANLFAMSGREVSAPAADHVWSPSDHAAYYSVPMHARVVDPFLTGPTMGMPEEPQSPDMARLSRELQMCFIDLEPDAPDVVATRALSSQLVPIWFGPGSGYAAHPRLRDIRQATWRSGTTPHFFP